MLLGNITSSIDLPQAAFWVFFLFFVGLVLVLRRNDKLEGYPLKSSPFNSTPLLGFPLPPEPRAYELNEGGITIAPHLYPQADVRAVPLYPFDGTPLSPVGNPLTAGLGPGAYVIRQHGPMLLENGELMLQPFNALRDWSLGANQTDTRSMTVFDWRWREIGTVHDFWVDRAIEIVRLFEVKLHAEFGGGHVLVPIFHVDIKERAREIRVTALNAHQFKHIPMPAAPDRITAREDERLNAYFAAGRFYRDSPLIDPWRGAVG